jgi:hypothetical protein
MLENLLRAAALMLLLFVAVRAVMWRLAWEARRNTPAHTKRGEGSKLWLLLLVLPAVGLVAVCTGHTDLARVCAATSLGVPFLFAGPKLWMSTAAFAATTEKEI